MTFMILDNGIQLHVELDTNYTTPIWSGRCDSGLVIKAPSNYPQIVNGIVAASAALASALPAKIPSDSSQSDCGFDWYVCGASNPSGCHPVTATATPYLPSVVARVNPAAPKTSYILEMNVSVTLAVQVMTQDFDKHSGISDDSCDPSVSFQPFFLFSLFQHYLALSTPLRGFLPCGCDCTQ